MSITTTPLPGEPKQLGAKRGLRSVFGKSNAGNDEVPAALLEFFSPTAALLAAPARAAARGTVYIIASMALTTFIIFAVFSVDRVVSAPGKVISTTAEEVVQPLASGVVKTIAVSEGDIVRKGQLLAQLDPTFTTADTTAATDEVDRYQTEIDRLTAELHQTSYKPRRLTAGAVVQEGIFAQRASAREAQLRYYQGQIEAQKALLAQAEGDVRQYAKETGVAVDVEKMREQLERYQVGSRLDTYAAVNARLEAEREVLAYVHQEENARQTVASLQGQLDSYNQQWFADASQTVTSDNVQLASYRDQLEHASLNSKLIDLRAKNDSIVLSVAPVSVGSVLQSGQTFFTLVPLNAPLELDVQASGLESGFVYAGQPVDIKFMTFSYTNFGEAQGTVRLVSADSFLTNNTTTAVGTSAGTTPNAVFTGQSASTNGAFFYDVRITLDRLQMKNLPKDFRVVPGMAVEADIRVGRRTIWNYLMERMGPKISDGMREPN